MGLLRTMTCSMRYPNLISKSICYYQLILSILLPAEFLKTVESDLNFNAIAKSRSNYFPSSITNADQIHVNWKSIFNLQVPVYMVCFYFL